MVTALGEPGIDLLFVYGTLRNGFARHNLLQRLGAARVGMGSIRAELFDLGDFPGAVKSKNSCARVAGEIYRLRNPARALKILDEVEGLRPAAPASSLFRRETFAVTASNGEQKTAWVYWLNRQPPAMRRIRSGDYAKR